MRLRFMAAGLLALLGAAAAPAQEPTLKEAFRGRFSIGAAVNASQVTTSDTRLQQLIRDEFDCLVAENGMKAEVVQPEEGKWNFADADRLVELCERNGQDCYGHCLVWHSQAPRWFFTDKRGKPVSRKVLVKRMKKHIAKVVGRYKGRIKAWDVVNEAIMDDGSFRRSPFYQIIGEDYFEIAFKAAHEADPDAMLFYNDFSMDRPGKRAAVVRLVKDLRAKGCRVDGAGMQSHLSFDTPLDEYEKTVQALADAGCKVMATELELSVLPWPGGNNGAAVEERFDYQESLNPYKDGLPADVERRQADFYSRLFDIYLRHSDAIVRVNFWGVDDGSSWKNGWPVPGRTDYPLFFDRQLKAKPFVKAIKDKVKNL